MYEFQYVSIFNMFRVFQYDKFNIQNGILFANIYFLFQGIPLQVQ
jgi:hypothetical protein